MLEARITTNPLIQSVVHHPFGQAVREIGLPDLAQVQFSRDIVPHLQNLAGHIDSRPASVRKLWQSITRGEVIAAEVWDDDSTVFYVRGRIGATGVDLRLVCHDHEWRVQSVTSVYSCSPLKSRWLRVPAYAVIVIAAGVVGYMLKSPVSSATGPVLLNVTSNSVNSTGGSAGNNGVATNTNTAETGSSVAAKTGSNTSSSKEGTKPSTTGSSSTGSSATTSKTSGTSSTPAQTNTSTPQTYTYTLALGAPLMDLAKFLATNHLVGDAMSFDLAMQQAGIDRSIQPGTYTFHSGMSQADILQTIKNGPAH